MTDRLDTTRHNLGELAAMSAQTERAERQIMERANELLADVESKLDVARAEAMAGDDSAQARYTDMVEERGRLQVVIARAREVLGAAA